MSKRQPSRSTVRLMPPTTESASRTVDVAPRLVSMYAAVRPAGPAPMMTTGSGAVTVSPWQRLARSGPRGPGCFRTFRNPGILLGHPSAPQTRPAAEPGPDPDGLSPLGSRIETGQAHELVDVVVGQHETLVAGPGRRRAALSDLLALAVERAVARRPDEPDRPAAGPLAAAAARTRRRDAVALRSA